MSLSFHADGRALVWNDDCLEALRQIPDGYADSIVTDPPYGLGFMGKHWDALPPGEEWAKECFRVLKPGGHLLAFGGSRTWHRLAVAVEDGGFELRDSIAWLYGSGFPKSLDVSKAIDKAAGAEREVVGTYASPENTTGFKGQTGRGVYSKDSRVDGQPRLITAPATDAAQQWQGWGTALKPAFEPIIVGRKPLAGTVAANVQEHGTGALNIDACRVAHDEPQGNPHTGNGGARSGGIMGAQGLERVRETTAASTAGRWPANVVLDESQAAELDAQTGILTSGNRAAGTYGLMGYMGADAAPMPAVNGDSGGASRFFPVFKYQAKAPAKERPKDVDGKGHPTVKPLELMRWLVRLVTPPNGIVLYTFAGSGTTGEAALLEGFRCLLIERETDYIPMIAERLSR